MTDRYDEELFLGYLEGDLSLEKTLEFEKLLVEDARLRNLVAQLVIDRHRLRHLPKEQAPPDLMDRVNATLERSMLLDAPAGDATPVAPWRRLKIGRIAAYASLAALVAIVSGLILQTLTDDGVRNLADQDAPSRVEKGPVVAAREPDQQALREEKSDRKSDGDKTNMLPGIAAGEASEGALKDGRAGADERDALTVQEGKLADAVNAETPPGPPAAASNAEASIDRLALGKSKGADEESASALRGGDGAAGARVREQFAAKQTGEASPEGVTTGSPAPAAAPAPAPTLEEMRQRMETRVDEFDDSEGDRDIAARDTAAADNAMTPTDVAADTKEESQSEREQFKFTQKDVPTPGAGNGLKLAAADLAIEVDAADPSEATTDVIIWAAQNQVKVAHDIQRSLEIQSVPHEGGRTRELRMDEPPAADASRVTLVLNGRQISELLAHLNRPAARTNATLTQQVPTASLTSASLKPADTLEPQTRPATRPAPTEGASTAGGEPAKEAEFRTVPVPMNEVAKSIPDEAEVQLPVVIRAAQDANESAK